MLQFDIRQLAVRHFLPNSFTVRSVKRLSWNQSQNTINGAIYHSR